MLFLGLHNIQRLAVLHVCRFHVDCGLVMLHSLVKPALSLAYGTIRKYHSALRSGTDCSICSAWIRFPLTILSDSGINASLRMCPAANRSRNPSCDVYPYRPSGPPSLSGRTLRLFPSSSLRPDRTGVIGVVVGVIFSGKFPIGLFYLI